MVEKNLEYYMSLPYEEHVIPSPEGGFVATVPDLPGCITQADTRLEVVEMIEDAKRCWLSAALEDEDDIPEPDMDLYNGRLNLRIPKSLHRKLAENAKREGVNLNQMAIYLLADGIGENQRDVTAKD
ncbi:MAG: toxin-antitoxin system HicB family antitoxin [Selenomonadaceae bacterium]|nr:toxin-antitoxin system HicB family antitoxin [Selenomonadaceae bacterium]